MARLYPPYIEGKLPAQSGKVLQIPFRFNRAVSEVDVIGVIARIKTVATNQWRCTTPEITATEKNFIYEQATDSYVAQITLPDTFQPIVGQYYKVQLAFYNAEQGLGYYSSVGIFKYSTQPMLYIDGLALNEETNINTGAYVGVYDQTKGDATEKVYTYSFVVRDWVTKEVLFDTGDLLHNHHADVANDQSSDKIVLNYYMQPTRRYGLIYKVKTLNGIEAESPEYLVVEVNNSIPIDLVNTLVATNDFENGRIILTMDTRRNNTNANRCFVVSKASSEDNYGIWHDIAAFVVAPQAHFPHVIAVDYLVQQGETYIYAIQQYQVYHNMRSARKTIEWPIKADFEDMFLYDGTRQLNIRFNPKVTNFKTTIQESKTDTIGNKYPFFFRNGYVGYKEFPISGLISYYSDPDELFMTNGVLGFLLEEDMGQEKHYVIDKDIDTYINNSRTTNLTSNNIYAERLFKLNALNFLNNGEIKLFKSPNEGNYLVRLMNVSLTPNDVVGRMLHTFNATAYEAKELTYDNLVALGFTKEIDLEAVRNNTKDYRVLFYQTLELDNSLMGKTLDFSQGDLINVAPNPATKIEPGICQLEFRDVPKKTIIKLHFFDESMDYEIEIGRTAVYSISSLMNPIKSIEFVSTDNLHGLFGYLDYGVISITEGGSIDDFTSVIQVKEAMTDGPAILQEYGPIENVMDNYKDLKFIPGAVYQIEIQTRTIFEIYYNPSTGEYYYAPEDTIPFQDFIPTAIYEEINTETGEHRFFDGSDENKESIELDFTYDLVHTSYEFPSHYSVRSEHYDLTGPKRITIRELPEVISLRLGNALKVDGVYQRLEYMYEEETDDPVIAPKRQAWDNAVAHLHELEASSATTIEQLLEAEQAERQAYNDFLQALDEVVL